MTEPTEALAVQEAAPLALFGTTDPLQVIRVAAGVATALAEVVNERKLYAVVNGRKFPTVEAWTLLGSMLGVFPITEWVHELRNEDGSVRGFEARVLAQTLTGRTVGAGEARCIKGESATWSLRSQEYALSSMAQTRATSKALRGPLDFVFKLAGFQPTPAEEMSTGEIPIDKATPESVAALKEAEEVTTPSQGSVPAIQPQPPSAQVNSAGAGSAPAPATRGPRAKRGNVVQAPQAAQTPKAELNAPPAAVVPVPALDGHEEYMDALRLQTREVAAKLQSLRVRLHNHKNVAEIALGNEAPQEAVPEVPNAGSDKALAQFINATLPGRTLASLNEDELSGTEAKPGILRTLEALVVRVEAALPK